MDFKTGDRVANKAKPEWGPGKVLHAENGIALVRFDSGAVRKLAVRFLEPQPAGRQAAPEAKTVQTSMQGSSVKAGSAAGPDDGGDGLIGRALAMLKSMEGTPVPGSGGPGKERQDAGPRRGRAD